MKIQDVQALTSRCLAVLRHANADVAPGDRWRCPACRRTFDESGLWPHARCCAALRQQEGRA